MPTFEIMTRAFGPEVRRRLARQIGTAAAKAGQPLEKVKVVFVEPTAAFVGAGEEVPAKAFARVEVTIGGLGETQRRELARLVCGLLCDEGIREDALTLAFRDSTGPQVAEGRGVFPFWPESGA